jgi:hypothetical protein
VIRAAILTTALFCASMAMGQTNSGSVGLHIPAVGTTNAAESYTMGWDAGCTVMQVDHKPSCPLGWVMAEVASHDSPMVRKCVPAGDLRDPE